jgi:hypothetical protein
MALPSAGLVLIAAFPLALETSNLVFILRRTQASQFPLACLYTHHACLGGALILPQG